MGKTEKPPVDVRHISKHNADIIEKLKNAEWNERLPSGCLTNHENNIAYITDFESFEGTLDYSFDDYSEFFQLKKAAYKEWKEVDIQYNTKYGMNPRKIIEVLRILHGGYKAKAMGEVVLGFTQATRPIIVFIPYKDDYAVFIVAPLIDSDGWELESVTIDETISFVDPVRVPLYYDLETQTIGYSYNDKILSVDEFKDEWNRKHDEYEKQLGKPPELKQRVDALTQYFFGGFGNNLTIISLLVENESKTTTLKNIFAWIKRKYEQIPFSGLKKSPYYDDFKPLFEIKELIPKLEKSIEGLEVENVKSIVKQIAQLGREYADTVGKYYKELTGKSLSRENIETRAMLEYRSKEQIQEQARWLQEKGIEPNSFEKAAMKYYGVSREKEPEERILKESTENGWLFKKILDGEYAGSLEIWVMGEGEYKIENIDVAPSFRRRGVASDLIEEVIKDFVPYNELKWGMQTGEGAKLKEALDKKYKIIEEEPWRRLMDVIKKLEKEHGLEVPEDVAIATATEVGIASPEDLIGELKRDGILYSPTKGRIARVEKEEKIQKEPIEEEMTLDEISLKKVKEKILFWISSEEQRVNTCDFDVETFVKLVTAHTTFTSAFFMRAIDELKAEGVLFSPREGVIRRTECKEPKKEEVKPPELKEPWQMTKEEYFAYESPIDPRDAKVDIGGIGSSLEVMPQMVYEYGGYLLAEATQHLVMGKFRMLFVWDKHRGRWHYVTSRGTARKFSEKERAKIIIEEKDDLDTSRNLDIFHKNAVRYALKEGKNVPAEVLEEYPDLVKPIPFDWGHFIKDFGVKHYTGYRTEAAYGLGGRVLRNVVKYEIEELYNTDIIDRTDVSDYIVMIDALYAHGYTEAVWLCKEEQHVIDRYCIDWTGDGDLTCPIEKYEITDGIVLSDLGEDGQLVAYQPKKVKIEEPEIELPKIPEIKEWQDIPDLDAQIRVIKEPTKDFNEWTVEIGLQESLGEQGGDIVTEFYSEKPTLEQIRKDIIKQYKETKAKINEEVAMGIVAKSGRDEMIEGAIDKVLAKLMGKKPEKIPEVAPPYELIKKERLSPEELEQLKKDIADLKRTREAWEKQLPGYEARQAIRDIADYEAKLKEFEERILEKVPEETLEEIKPVKPPVEERTEIQETVYEYFKKEIAETDVEAYQRGYLDALHREIGREFTVDHLLLSDSEELYTLMDLKRGELEAELKRIVVPVPPKVEEFVEGEKLEILRKMRKYKKVEAEVSELKIGAKVTMNDKEGFLVDISAGKYRVNWDDGTWDWILKKNSEIVIVY